MSFTEFCGLGPRVHRSTLAAIPESLDRPVPPVPESAPAERRLAS